MGRVKTALAWQPVASGVQESLTYVLVDPAGRIWACGQPSLLRSADGGATFQVVGRWNGTVEGVWSDGAQHAVACADGAIVASADDGRTWHPTTCRGRYNSGLRGQGGQLWATNIRGRVLSSVDGAKWRSVESKSRKFLYCVGANSTGTVCAGSEGSFALSRNGGASFRVTKLGHRQYLRDVHVFASGEVVLVGDEGNVHCVDREGVVTSVALDEDINLFGVHEVDGHLLAAGNRSDGAAVLRSKNRGRTWKAEPAPSTRWLHSIASLRDGRLVAVGVGGTVFISA